MPSHAATIARRGLVKEVVDPSKSLAQERAEWDAFGDGLPVSPDVTVEIAALANIPCTWLRPSRDEAKVTILYAHGGGLTTGSMLTHRALAGALAVVTGCDVVVPDYRLLPEHPPAAPSDDLLAVYCALSANKGTIILGGDSSGGGLALTLARRLVGRDVRQPAGVFAMSGAFDATLSGASHMEREAADPILSYAVLRHWQTQLGDQVDLRDPLISPLFADLSGLPPTLLLAGEDEVWHDDTVRMHSALHSAHVPCAMRIYAGMWHVWPMMTALPEAQQAFEDIARFIDRVLDKAD